MGYFYNSPKTIKTRRALKHNLPATENRLWYYLRNRRFYDIKFRRQYSVNNYVIDFYCPAARVAIEIDGDSHFTGDAPKQDRLRQQFIENCGIKVLRFTNKEVMENIEGVLETIHQAIAP